MSILYFIKNKILFLALVLCCFSAVAQTVPYSLAAVSETLKSNASVITHLEAISLDVESLEKATLRMHKIFTVVDDDGKEALLFNEYSTKFISLDEVEIRVYDEAGKQVQKFKKKDMATVAVGEGLVDEGYVTYYRIKTPSYPVTVEVNYEQKFKSTLYLPKYRFIQSKEAVVESNYTVKVPADLHLRYKAEHSSVTPAITEDGKYKIYKWTVKNLSPVENEEGSVGSDGFPYINIVSDQFSHYGFRGDLSSWKSFGSWINDLYKGLDELPADRQQFFQALVADAPTEREKIRRIYQFLQQNFRYVSIQLGIGGLRPFSATFTDQKKYGDCKALSNYMKAALKTVGIRSHIAIINAEYNQEPVDPGFPANSFNHAILCVPEPKDSIWLECTSSTTGFGQLGTFTENRNALLITEGGGVLVPTPKSTAASNSFNTHTTITMEDDLSAIADTKMETTGEFREQMADVLKQNRDDQKEILVFYLGYKQPDFFELSATNTATDQQAALKMELRKLPEFNSGTKYFINPRIHKMWTSKLPTAENRKLDFYFHFPFEKEDTTIIKLPAGFKPDVLPTGKALNTAYGSYQSRYWYNETENAVYSATSFSLKKHKVLAADYRMVKAFFDEVLQDDAQRIVVNKKVDSSTEKKAF